MVGAHVAVVASLDADGFRRAEAIIAEMAGREGAALPILHALQEAFGFVPKACETLIADALNLSRAEVHGIITFYHDFRRAPAGRHVLKLCRAEACQSRGAVEQSERLLSDLGIGWGGTTGDGRLTIEAVYCLGLCACGPSALLDGEPHAMLNEAGLAELVLEARAA